MKIKLKPEQVQYNPKTDEYTIETNLQFVGTLYGVPIYCERTDYGTLFLLEKRLAGKF